MNIAKFHDHCCGCGECLAVCPVQAISMEQNNQGFYYPVVNEEKCIHCSLCVSRCTFNSKGQRNHLLEAYALKHTNEDIRAASRSGGVFTALSDQILDVGGAVYGCQLVHFKDAVHARATSREERDALRGSKYIQSKTHDIFPLVKKDLENGMWVLFSGTACQVNAIKDYCRDISCEKLLLVDIVCHGVPSPKVWTDYLDYLTDNNKEISAVDFRDKQQFGWAEHKETVWFSDGSQYSGDTFKRLFYNHYILRKDCFACPYRDIHRVADITIADCWGIAQHYPQFDDNKGVSLVLVNTLKGSQFFNGMKETLSIPVDINKLLQTPLKENWEIPDKYDQFWKYYHSHSFGNVIKKYALRKQNIFRRLIRKGINICRRIFKIRKK